MKMTLRTLFSHWKRHPLQLALMVLGLSLATTLWSAVQALNSEARSSYAAAAQTLSQQEFAQLELHDKSLTLQDYVRLRRAGIAASPVIEGRMQISVSDAGTDRGESEGVVDIIGIDPLSYPRAGQLIAALEGQPGTGDASPGLLDMLSDRPLVFASEETRKTLMKSDLNWRISTLNIVPQGSVIVDISVAERVLEKSGTLSHILLPDPGEWVAAQEILPQAHLREPSDAALGDISQLTRSFHLNLTAFGLLSFAVGLFIVQGMITLGVEQRRKTIAILRYLGVTTRQLTLALLLEVLALALVSGLLGIVLGYFLAAVLISDVSATLSGLYGAEVAGSLQLRPGWVVSGLAMALLGAGLASVQALLRLRNCAEQLTELGRPQSRLRAKPLFQIAFAGLILIFAGAAVLWLGKGLIAGFVFLAGLMLGAALLLPIVLFALISLGATRTRRAMSQFFWADLRSQLPGLSMALMALMLAVATNIGVGTMVSSFRATFVGWLDQRLSAQVYVSAETAQKAAEVFDWADKTGSIALPLYRKGADYGGAPLTLLGVVDDRSYRENWPLLQSAKGAWDWVHQRGAILINEQMARRFDLSVGEDVTLDGFGRKVIAGIYSDYGNPTGQIILSATQLAGSNESVELQRIGLRHNSMSAAEMIRNLRQAVDFKTDDIISQPQIKALSLSIFDRTFVITGALNILTLAVAGFALFTSFLTQWSQRLPQLAPLWAMGVDRQRLAQLDLIRSLLLALFCFLCALPLGVALAWALLAIVNVEAFGWRLPMRLFPGDWLRVLALTGLAALLAALTPALRLLRAEPAQLLGSFSNDR